MKKTFSGILIISLLLFLSGFKPNRTEYQGFYLKKTDEFKGQQLNLLEEIKTASLISETGHKNVLKKLHYARLQLKGLDFWLRYLEPISYKQINGPLPVEWENEVFEKFEKPYKRLGAGLTLAEEELSEDNPDRKKLADLIQKSINALAVFSSDSITKNLETHHHFFLANRLYLLNLAAIYTTGFECPDTTQVITELRFMLNDVKATYELFNQGFSETPLTAEYLELYDKTLRFVQTQSTGFSQFDHFTFIRDYVNPLFAMNQQFIRDYNVVSTNFNDYSLNDKCNSIFDKSLYEGMNAKGIYTLVDDAETLQEIRQTGKLFFYDPILSGNNKRSCASCHKPTQYFTDTVATTSLQFDGYHLLPRNTPSLLNVNYNHLLMFDGKHISLQAQGKDVITNPIEMGSNENELLEKVLSCKDYKKSLKKFTRYTPEEKDITLQHIVSAITFYYSDFSSNYSHFDYAMENKKELTEEAKRGFNIFMSKAQCGTCHFVPQFNGVKPPYIGSEFEVLGVPHDTTFTGLSPDKGRYEINPANETFDAFRTGTIRNAQFTRPYMHNGVFKTLNEVIDFYDAGGGAGKGLKVPNQTLESDSLHLSQQDKKDLLAFIFSLSENVIFENPPAALPLSKNEELNTRKVGGEY
ncbi:MAG: cytochrome-c peroxidase [Bacteroidia bacterium]